MTYTKRKRTFNSTNNPPHPKIKRLKDIAEKNRNNYFKALELSKQNEELSKQNKNK